MENDKKRLSEKQEMALELAVTGMTDVEIARQVGVSRQWVNKWRNQDQGFMEALAERREVMRAMHMNRICQLMDRAMIILEEAMETADEKTRLKTAMYVMKMSGLQGFAKPPQVISQEDQTLQALQQALGQVAEEMGFQDPTK